jgi:hypothetical protein
MVESAKNYFFYSMEVSVMAKKKTKKKATKKKATKKKK